MRHLLRALPIAVVVAFLVPAVHPHSVSASPVDQQRRRVEDIVDELERLEQQALQLAEDYVEALDRQSELAQEIVDAEARIAEKEAEVDRIKGDLGDMAVHAFVNGGGTSLGPLFEETADVNDVLRRDEFARVALSAGDLTTDELDALVADLEDERDELDDKRQEQADLASYLESQQSQTEQRRAEYQQARADAEARLGELIAEEEARRAAEAAARVQAEFEAAQREAANNQASTSSGSSGGGSPSSGSSAGSSGSSGSSGGGSPSSGGSSGGGGSPSSGGSSGGGGSAPPPSSLAGVAVNAALGQQGVPYRFAASNPGVAFDCSGLTKYAWGQAGVYLPHQSRAQYAAIPHVSQGAAQPGDLIFYYSPISHVGVYLGGGQLVHAPATGDVVKVAGVNWSKVTGVGRPG